MEKKAKPRRLHRYKLKFVPRGRRQVFTWGRNAFLLLVKFAPGKKPKDFVDFFNRVDEKLYRRYGKTRHELGIHERKTYLLEGDYQLAVLWDAPSKEMAKKFLALWLKKGGAMHMSDGSGLTASSNTVTLQGRY